MTRPAAPAAYPGVVLPLHRPWRDRLLDDAVDAVAALRAALGRWREAARARARENVLRGLDARTRRDLGLCELDARDAATDPWLHLERVRW